jgi:hypothetical protein
MCPCTHMHAPLRVACSGLQGSWFGFSPFLCTKLLSQHTLPHHPCKPSLDLSLFAPTPPHSFYIKIHTHASLTIFFITFYSLLLHPLTIFSSVIAKQTQTRSLSFSHSKQKHTMSFANTQQRLSTKALPKCCSRTKRTGTWDQTQV